MYNIIFVKKKKEEEEEEKRHLRAPPTWNLYLSGAKGTVASNLCYIALPLLLSFYV
jgi:hypothetical protein